VSHQELGQAATVIPSTFDAPPTGTREAVGPGKELLLLVRGSGTAPGTENSTGIIKRERLMDGLVGIDANRHQNDLPTRTMGSTGLSGERNASGFY